MNVWTVRCGVLAAAAMLATCGGENPNEPSPPVATNTVTITTTGVNPKVALIAPGQRIRFVNNDVRAHNVASDPHPEHNDCPEFDQVGFLAVGQQRETGNFVTVKTCGYHDHDLPDLAQLKGQIQVR